MGYSLPPEHTRKMTCPICGNVVDPLRTIAMPFCSPRCKQIDLGRWLNEEIHLPVEPSAEDEDDTSYEA